jgi:iron(III) transport system substrate-binding protein
MVRAIVVLLALAVVVALPFLLKPEENLLARADETLVIITPHNEAIRYEFSRAFSTHYENLTGRSVRIDWRMPGGTSEIARYLQGEFFAAFHNAWRQEGREWTPEVQAAFDNPKVELPADPAADSPAQAARRAFLASDVGIGIDLFFGGGAFDFNRQASAGRLVDSGVLERHPSWFAEDSIPHIVSGEEFYDEEGRWVGAVISAFGICFNTDSLERLGVDEIPASWEDLTRPEFVKEVALADPTKSGSVAKAFEMIIQQQMQIRAAGPDAKDLDQALAEGWLAGLGIIQRASANARYFTDAASKVPVDVSQGDAAIGMCIDFYGRYQSEAVRVGETESRLQYFTPAGGSSVGVDPVGMLRGAPNPEVARHFIDFVLSIEGQKLWNFKVGVPGGPVRYALRRLPVRKELYAPEFEKFRSDPGVFPYEEARMFTYHPGWTGPLFKAMGFIVRVSCLDPHDEQVAAWKALIAAGFPPLATERFSDLSAVGYAIARDEIAPALSSADRILEVRLAKRLGDHFRKQYREAAELARKGQ